MSFLGHPVCRLGLNWCILLGLFIVFFFTISYNAHVLSVFPFGKQYKVNNAFKYLIPMHTKSCITINVSQKKWHYELLFGMFGGIIRHFYGFIYKMFYLLLLLIFLSFPDKNLWFSSHRRREGVVGDVVGDVNGSKLLIILITNSQK